MPAVAIYARFSPHPDQRDESIDDQIRVCRLHADKQPGWSIVECYSDARISGASVLLRSGIQELIQDALAGKFDILLAESLDRISRDQEDIAGVYKRLSFAGIQIVTLSEGPISELHIGLKGTMGALYLKDLADKTRRGLRGRVEAGKSGGGNAYGYDVVHKVGSDGEPVRGDRRINKAQAGIVRRIFNEYAAGKAPRAIAHKLNAEGVAGPSGKGWGPSTIHGHRQRGTGILNNEMYIGRLVWNRLRYVKDPDTGKRVSKLNPESEWIVQDVPELRIIDDELWEKVKARQSTMRASRFAKDQPGYWDRRRPRYLFSGLMKCAECGGGVIYYNKAYVGCATARNKGTCTNKISMRRDDLEALVLEGLEKHLMDPALTEIFCQRYAETMNRLVSEHNAGLHAKRAELEKVGRDIDKLVQAILDGVPGSQVKDKMAALEQRKEILERQLDQAEEMPVSLHPNLAGFYREQIGRLKEALTDESIGGRAADVMRSLIDRIELVPAEYEGRKILEVNLHGRLAGILSLAMNADKPLDERDLSMDVVKLVAGAGFEPATFRL